MHIPALHLFRSLLTLLVFFISLSGNGQVLFSENFDAPTLPVGWSTTDASGNGTDLLWTICTDPTACAPYTSAFTTETTFAAPGAADGYAVADSDAHGDQAQDFISRLQSPRIDCSGAPTVFLSFQSFIATAIVPPAGHALVQVRLSDGPWTNFDPYCTLRYADQNLRSPNPQLVVLDLSDLAANEADVELRWQWTGDWEYSWSIDEVRLTVTDPHAESVVWGAASGQGDFAGGPNGWTVNVLSAPGPDQSWRWSPDGYLGDAFFALDTRHLDAPSVCNGAMVFNADHYSTNGDTPIDPPYPVYVGELISPSIDLSAQDSELALSFWEEARLFEPAPGYAFPTFFTYSTDDGATWSIPVDLHPDLPQSEVMAGQRVVPLPPALLGQATVRLKFTFAAQFFYWAIDDVQIRRRRAYDLALTSNYVVLPPNAVTPLSQLDTLFFGTDVRNDGSEAVDSVRLRIRVDDLLAQQPIYRDSLYIGPVAPDELLTDRLLPQPFINLNAPGLYAYTYEVSGTPADEFLPNNRYQNTFQVSDTIFAKERGRTRAIAPTGNIQRYAYGNCFYVPNGEGYLASSITFGLANAADLAGDNLIVHLYEWAGDLNANGLADEDLEYEALGINVYSITGEEGNNLITVPLLSAEGEALTLRDDRYYLATVEYDGLNSCFFQASEAYNYTATYVLSDSLHRPRYASVLRTDFQQAAYDLIGFGLDVVPVVRLNIRNGTTASPVARAPELHLFPNPTSDRLYWTDLPNGLRPVAVEHPDGRSVAVAWSAGSVAIDRLVDGLYYLVMSDGARRYHYPFVVQR